MATNSIFLVWKDDSRKGEYFPVGRLDKVGKAYRFQYVRGVHKATAHGFTLLPDFPDARGIYNSNELFPLFSNRLMSRRRPNFAQYLHALDLPQSENFLLELARSGGKRTTDRFRVFEMPAKKAGRFDLTFFAVGLTRPPVASIVERIADSLEPGTKILLTPQVQNSHDPKAIMLHTEENEHVGWLPRYFACEIQPLLLKNPKDITCSVARLNYPLADYAPDMLLVRLRGKWPARWMPFQTEEFELLATAKTRRVA